MDTLTHQVCTVSCRSATLSPLAFSGESNPNFPRGKSQWKNTAAIIIIIIVMIITRHERSVSRSVSSTCMSTQVLRPTALTEELLQPMVWASSLALWETLPREAPSEKSVSRLETTNKPGQHGSAHAWTHGTRTSCVVFWETVRIVFPTFLFRPPDACVQTKQGC